MGKARFPNIVELELIKREKNVLSAGKKIEFGKCLPEREGSAKKFRAIQV